MTWKKPQPRRPSGFRHSRMAHAPSAKMCSTIHPIMADAKPHLKPMTHGLTAVHWRVGHLIVDGVFRIERREGVDIRAVAGVDQWRTSSRGCLNAPEGFPGPCARIVPVIADAHKALLLSVQKSATPCFASGQTPLWYPPKGGWAEDRVWSSQKGTLPCVKVAKCFWRGSVRVR